MSSSATSGPRRLSGGHDLIPAADLGHHLEVVLEVEQCRER